MSLKVLAQTSALCCLALLASYSVRAQAQGEPAKVTDSQSQIHKQAQSLPFRKRQIAQVQTGQQAAGGGDPMSIYKAAGISQEQEMRIRQLAKDFEDQARVKAKRVAGLLQEMHELSLQADPEEKSVLGKQDEINQMTSEMATDRIKLLLSIRKTLSPEQKQKLITIMKDGSGQSQ
jgi:Spy/CpxP family protein refolding chaperone